MFGLIAVLCIVFIYWIWQNFVQFERDIDRNIDREYIFLP